jgi:hypothetical protein
VFICVHPWLKDLFLGRMTEAQVRQIEDAQLEWLEIRRQV